MNLNPISAGRAAVTESGFRAVLVMRRIVDPCGAPPRLYAPSVIYDALSSYICEIDRATRRALRFRPYASTEVSADEAALANLIAEVESDHQTAIAARLRWLARRASWATVLDAADQAIAAMSVCGWVVNAPPRIANRARKSDASDQLTLQQAAEGQSIVILERQQNQRRNKHR